MGQIQNIFEINLRARSTDFLEILYDASQMQCEQSLTLVHLLYSTIRAFSDCHERVTFTDLPGGNNKQGVAAYLFNK
ncbi:unnamed protein product [Trichogramma brassicae]|uniref:Uncharacterized protein n=1 Tax=Trichogramma brassicae TaxID=86971 RepID=A0A6H5HS24_9HYME|nr:unnamed protein product [Trichogramma brassicae]